MMRFICINFFWWGVYHSTKIQSESSSMVECSLAKAKAEGSIPFFRLGLSRLELLTLRLSGVHSNQLSYRPFVLGKGRTLNLRIRSSALYPLSYEHFAGEKGFEPLTFGFGDHCSTIGTTLLKSLSSSG